MGRPSEEGWVGWWGGRLGKGLGRRLGRRRRFARSGGEREDEGRVWGRRRRRSWTEGREGCAWEDKGEGEGRGEGGREGGEEGVDGRDEGGGGGGGGREGGEEMGHVYSEAEGSRERRGEGGREGGEEAVGRDVGREGRRLHHQQPPLCIKLCIKREGLIRGSHQAVCVCVVDVRVDTQVDTYLGFGIWHCHGFRSR